MKVTIRKESAFFFLVFLILPNLLVACDAPITVDDFVNRTKIDPNNKEITIKKIREETRKKYYDVLGLITTAIEKEYIKKDESNYQNLVKYFDDNSIIVKNEKTIVVRITNLKIMLDRDTNTGYEAPELISKAKHWYLILEFNEKTNILNKWFINYGVGYKD